MIETPRIVQTTPLELALIHLTIPKDQIQHVMGPGITELRAAVAAQGIEVTGAWLTHHLKIDAAGWDFEICVPVARPIAPAGRVRPGRWPAMTVGRTDLHGGYEQLPMAWPELDTWIAVGGHTAAPDLWEVYLVDPETNADPLAWRTQLNRPLVAVAPKG